MSSKKALREFGPLSLSVGTKSLPAGKYPESGSENENISLIYW